MAAECCCVMSGTAGEIVLYMILRRSNREVVETPLRLPGAVSIGLCGRFLPVHCRIGPS
jgi:hypothetical protein